MFLCWFQPETKCYSNEMLVFTKEFKKALDFVPKAYTFPSYNMCKCIISYVT